MQTYATIIGILRMKKDGFSYESIQHRFCIGSSTMNRTLNRLDKLDLSYEELSQKAQEEVEEHFPIRQKGKKEGCSSSRL